MRASNAVWLAWFAFLARLAAQTPPTGRQVFEKRCAGCHDLDRDKEGPHLRGVVGRSAAAVPGFPYSDALKKSGIHWTDVLIDRWLAGPDQLVPGTDMEFHVEKAAERKAIVDYLKQR